MCAFRLALAAVVAAATASLAGCSGGPAPVTGLSLEIRYDDPAFATIDVSGAAESSNRNFGPYHLTTDKLASGDTIGLVFDASDAGVAMVCAQGNDASGRALDTDCGTFRVKADEVLDGSLSLHQQTGGGGGGGVR